MTISLYTPHHAYIMCVGNWLQKVLSDMMGKATGNQTLADKKVFLYSAVSWWAAGTGLNYCTIEIQRQLTLESALTINLVLENTDTEKALCYGPHLS